MADVPVLDDVDSARTDGELFGRMIGQETAAGMLRDDVPHAELTGVGVDGVTAILRRAQTLADSGFSQEIVEAWTEAASEAFNEELERAAALLKTTGTRH